MINVNWSPDSVRLERSNFFDPAGMDIKTGDHVIVETARGIEFGHVVLGSRLWTSPR